MYNRWLSKPSASSHSPLEQQLTRGHSRIPLLELHRGQESVESMSQGEEDLGELRGKLEIQGLRTWQTG